MVGPLYADDTEVAKALMQALCQDILGEKLVLNLWFVRMLFSIWVKRLTYIFYVCMSIIIFDFSYRSTNPCSINMFTKAGYEKVFDVMRMHTGPAKFAQQMLNERVYLVTSIDICGF